MRFSWKKGGAVLLLGITVLLWCFVGSRHGLELSSYALSSPKISAPIRIVQLGDLHNSEFGEANSRLVTLVKKQRPDLILLTGDMLNGDEPRTDIATRLIEQLVQIAPVYAAQGNHEKANSLVFSEDIRGLYERAGAVWLEESYEDVSVKGQTVRIGGILGYCLSEKYLRLGEAKPHEVSFLKNFQDTSLYTMLLCHFPLCWIINDNLEQWDIDCVFAGHTHGGQIRLPIVGGVYAPDEGLFPGKTYGLYGSQDGSRVMVLTRGLGSRGAVPRVNNVPEIVVLDILPQMK